MASYFPTMQKQADSVWTIRRASSDDLKSIVDLQLRSRRPRRTDSKTKEYFVAMVEQKIVGCAAVRKRKDLGYLYGLVVEKTWRRRGIGHALTHVRLDWLRHESAVRVFVLAMFWNIKFFRKHGFALVDKRKAHGLRRLHCDFEDAWSSRSALLHLELSSRVPS
jgi:N-acetylglutamate synthase-like GNAT family acetyltransferase